MLRLDLSPPAADSFPRSLAAPQPVPPYARSPLWLLFALAAIALVPRLILTERLPGLCSDGVHYWRQVQRIELGDWERVTPDVRLSTYPVALIGLARLGWDLETAAILWGLCTASLAVLPLFGWVRRQFDDRVAIVAAVLYAVHPMFIQWTPEMVRESTFWLLWLTSLYFTWRAVTEVRLLLFAAAGVSIALAIHTRFEGWLLLVPLAAWSLWRGLALSTARGRLACGVTIVLAAIPLYIVAMNLTWLGNRTPWEWGNFSRLSYVAAYVGWEGDAPATGFEIPQMAASPVSTTPVLPPATGGQASGGRLLGTGRHASDRRLLGTGGQATSGTRQSTGASESCHWWLAHQCLPSTPCTASTPGTSSPSTSSTSGGHVITLPHLAALPVAPFELVVPRDSAMDTTADPLLHPPLPANALRPVRRMRLAEATAYFVAILYRSFSIYYLVPMFLGLGCYFRTWLRREHQPLFYVSLMILAAMWVHLWYGQASSSRYPLSIVLASLPFAALGCLQLVHGIAAWLVRREPTPRFASPLAAGLLLLLSMGMVFDALITRYNGRIVDRAIGRWLAEQYGPELRLAVPVSRRILAHYAGEPAGLIELDDACHDARHILADASINASIDALVLPRSTLTKSGEAWLTAHAALFGLEPLDFAILPDECQTDGLLILARPPHERLVERVR